MSSFLGARRRLTLASLTAATYFIVSGGPYGLEELIATTGYSRSLLVLLLIPLVWSLPTAWMVGELAAALPQEGGYYAWVRRALGPFWGFQEAWFSIAASIFDLAIYPTLFALYLGQLIPALGSGARMFCVKACVLLGCTLWNLRGAKAVGGLSFRLGFAVLLPFVFLTILGLLHPSSPPPPHSSSTGGLVTGLLVAMWNYMGWDNASTFAGEVERPQRNYPVAIACTLVLVTLSYVLPVLAARHAGLSPASWVTGAWVDVATIVGGHGLGLAVVAGGMASATASCAALVLSYSRVPAALAEDGYLPALLARRQEGNGVPWVAVLVCGALYMGCLGLGFERLVQLDVVLYGLSLLLEFVALIVLRIREPDLPRPVRVPGGILGVTLIAIPPLLLMGVAVVLSFSGPADSTRDLLLGLGVAAFGAPLFWLVERRRRRRTRDAVLLDASLPLPAYVVRRDPL